MRNSDAAAVDSDDTTVMTAMKMDNDSNAARKLLMWDDDDTTAMKMDNDSNAARKLLLRDDDDESAENDWWLHVSPEWFSLSNQTLTLPSSITRILSQDKTVLRRWAMISMVQSQNASFSVAWTSASVSVSMAAVASSSINI